jgi:formamidopyrimidine-DNA glycosylase
MPELPEVETVRRSLEPLLPGRRVESVWTSGKPLRLNRALDVRTLRAVTVGKRVLAVRRRAKYLLVDFEGGGVVVVHLGMTGQLRVAPASEPRAPHTHVVLALDGGRELRFVDPRRFGTVAPFRSAALAEAWPELAKLGVDPLGEAFTGEALHALARGTARGLKLLLLDQARIGGVGNIYASEALWEARLHPHKRGWTLTLAQARALRDAVVLVLERGLANRGTSFSDYVDADGEKGSNQQDLRVYGRAGETCRRCKRGRIKAVITQGRGTFFCPSCQGR